MHKVKVLLVGVLAVFAFTATSLAATASAAEPSILNAKGEVLPQGTKLTGSSGVATLTAASTITCKTSSATGEVTTTTLPILGTLHIDFKECKLLGGPCHSLTDTGENILFLGEFHVWYDSLTTLGVAAVILMPSGGFHIVCEKTLIGEVLLLVTGGVVGLLKPVGAKAKSLELVVKSSGRKQEDKKFWSGGVEKTTELLTSVNGGAAEESGENAENSKVELASGEEAEVMG